MKSDVENLSTLTTYYDPSEEMCVRYIKDSLETSFKYGHLKEMLLRLVMKFRSNGCYLNNLTQNANPIEKSHRINPRDSDGNGVSHLVHVQEPIELPTNSKPQVKHPPNQRLGGLYSMIEQCMQCLHQEISREDYLCV